MGVTVISLTAPVGVSLGLIAGYKKGTWVETLVMRITDIFVAVPPLILALAVAAILLASTAAMAQSAATLVGEFKVWKTYVASTPEKTCYIASQPQDSTYSQSISGRDPAFFMVTTIFKLEDGGRFDPEGSKMAFRRRVDPHGLMNPGKLRSVG